MISIEKIQKATIHVINSTIIYQFPKFSTLQTTLKSKDKLVNFILLGLQDRSEFLNYLNKAIIQFVQKHLLFNTSLFLYNVNVNKWCNKKVV